MTDFIKKSELDNRWYHIDATNVVVGRLAAEISKILRGKNKQLLLLIWIMVIL